MGIIYAIGSLPAAVAKGGAVVALRQKKKATKKTVVDSPRCGPVVDGVHDSVDQ